MKKNASFLIPAFVLLISIPITAQGPVPNYFWGAEPDVFTFYTNFILEKDNEDILVCSTVPAVHELVMSGIKLPSPKLFTDDPTEEDMYDAAYFLRKGYEDSVSNSFDIYGARPDESGEILEYYVFYRNRLFMIQREILPEGYAILMQRLKRDLMEPEQISSISYGPRDRKKKYPRTLEAASWYKDGNKTRVLLIRQTVKAKKRTETRHYQVLYGTASFNEINKVTLKEANKLIKERQQQ